MKASNTKDDFNRKKIKTKWNNFKNCTLRKGNVYFNAAYISIISRTPEIEYDLKTIKKIQLFFSIQKYEREKRIRRIKLKKSHMNDILN